MKIAICEDDIKDTEILRQYVENWSEKNSISVIIRSFSSAEQFMFCYPEDMQFDIVFLDINMAGIDGITVSQRIREIDDRIGIVFTTSLTEHALRGYDVGALHYLIKPLQQKYIWICLDRVLQNIYIEKQKPTVLSISTGKANITLKLDELFYCIMFDHNIDVHTEKDFFSFRIPISEFEKLLPPKQFVRCHRSYIVNLEKVKMIIDENFILDNNFKIPIAKRNLEKVKSAFVAYYR